jgi:hypothetical protein
VKNAHCRVCYQSLTGIQIRCRQCGAIDRFRIVRLVWRGARKVGGFVALLFGMWAVFYSATR